METPSPRGKRKPSCVNSCADQGKRVRRRVEDGKTGSGEKQPVFDVFRSGGGVGGWVRGVV